VTGNELNSMPDERKLNDPPVPREGVGFRAAISVGSRARDDALTGRVSIRSRAPLRLGLAGGGTDLSPYCDEFGGAILNATIGRYAYAHLSFRDDGLLCFSAHDADQEDETAAAQKLSLDKGLLLHRAVFNRITRDFFNGRVCSVTVSSVVDAPTGSGLGASSALVVAMVEAYRSAFGLPLGRYDVARLAYEIERIDLGLAGGRQDQYAAAFGGVNFIEFLPGDRTIVNPLRIPPAYLSELEASLLICFTGQARASAIIQDQVKGVITNDPGALEAMHRLKADAIDMKQALLGGDIHHVAQILNRSWQSKQRTSRLVSNASIERVFDLGLKNGAVAGKVSGAGGGGFLMFMTSPEQRHRLVSALNEAGVAAASVQFTEGGVQAWVTNC
jgi:D-glycero-alpha-D-manno-heptose-7-phosphate kinase